MVNVREGTVSEFSLYAHAAAERSTRLDRPTAEGATPHDSPQTSRGCPSAY